MEKQTVHFPKWKHKIGSKKQQNSDIAQYNPRHMFMYREVLVVVRKSINISKSLDRNTFRKVFKMQRTSF